MHRGVFFFLNASTCEDCEIMFVHLVERILRSQRPQLKLLAASGRQKHVFACKSAVVCFSSCHPIG